MPILIAPTVVGEPGGGANELVQAWSEDVGSMVAVWTDPLGVNWPLTDTSDDVGHFTTPQVAGWGAMPYELVRDPIASGGETVRFVRQLPGRLTWKMHIWGETHQQFIDRYRAIKRAFLMTVHRGMLGTLTVYRPDGTGRFIECMYEEGFGGESGENWLSANPVITLYCPDGAWRDITPITVRRDNSTPAPFFSPFLTLSASRVLGATSITNPGDLPAWPEWTIKGPAASLTASNHTTGKTFTLTYPLAGGESATIITGGARPRARGPGGINLSTAMNWPLARYWGLAQDVNDIDFQVTGSEEATAITLLFHPRYDGA